MDPKDPNYEKLQQVLVELFYSQPSWGEKLPKSWIYLKMMINRAVEKGDAIMSMEKMRSINQNNPVQSLSENELQLFLKINHSQGEIIYFPLPDLSEQIVISPKFLVDALRSLITDKRFCKGDRLKTLKTVHQHGFVKRGDIYDIWKGYTKFMQYKQYLLSLMGHLDILATPRMYNEFGDLIKSDSFYVPSLVKSVNDTCYLERSFEARSLGLSFKFHSSILPPAIGYRIIASCVDLYEVQRYNDKMLLFSGMVIVKVKKNLDLVVILRSDRVDIALLHSTSRLYILRDTANGVLECLTDILTGILESYKLTSSEGEIKQDVPFHIEFPCYEVSSPCYTNESSCEFACMHGHKLTKEIRCRWFVDRVCLTICFQREITNFFLTKG